MTVDLDESDRQLILMALAHLAVERPGWNLAIELIVAKMDTAETPKRRQIEALACHHSLHVRSGKFVVFERFKALRRLNLEACQNASLCGPSDSAAPG